MGEKKTNDLPLIEQFITVLGFSLGKSNTAAVVCGCLMYKRMNT